MAPFPSLPFVVGTDEGDLYFALVDGRPSGTKVRVCDGAILTIVARLRQALVYCGPNPMAGGWYLWDESKPSVLPVAVPALPYATFDGAGGVVYVALGKDASPAPIPMTRLLRRDIMSGSTSQIDEAFVVAADLRLTSLGVAVWRPRNNNSFVRSEADAGTWLLQGSSLAKFSTHRLIDAASQASLLESEPKDSQVGCCRVLYLRTGTEQRLTPNDVADERALALLDDGSVLAWRPGTGEFEGDVALYRGGAVVRLDHGSFSPSGALRSGDWIVAQRPIDPGLVAYRIGDGAFASVSLIGVRSLALLAAK